MDIRTYIKQLDQLMKEYDAIYHMAAVAYGLSDTAMWILYMVSDATETYTQQDLCRQCCFPKQTINTAINNLIRNGYLTLETLPGTRNSKRIILTDAGQALMQTTIDPLKQAEDAAYSKFSDAERQRYLELTRRLNTNLREELQAQLKRRTL